MIEDSKQAFSWFSFLTMMIFVHVWYFVHLGERNPPELVIHTRGKIFSSLKRIARGKVCPSHPCDVNIPRKLADDFSTFSKVSRSDFLRKSRAKSERIDRFRPGKILTLIEHVSYPIRYCKISLLIYSGSSSLSNAGRFFSYSPGSCVANMPS